MLLIVLPGVLCAQPTRLRLATTTSTENSGLLAAILPPFEDATGITVDVIAVGTGAAIRLGEVGDVDVILVHAPAAEMKFVEAGYGVNRRSVMHNDFIVLGPADDPSGVAGAIDVVDVFRKIAVSFGAFASRGDDSGTHKKELEIWSEAGIAPGGRWYKELGQGMGAVLVIASELGAYSLADRGTYLAMTEQLDLKIVFEGDRLLHNPYSVIAVNPALHGHVSYESAVRLIAWLTSPNGQELIGSFSRYGEALFYPDAVP